MNYNSLSDAKGALYAAVSNPAEKPRNQTSPLKKVKKVKKEWAENIYREFRGGGTYYHKGRRYSFPELLEAAEYIRGSVRSRATSKDPKRPDWAVVVKVDEESMAYAICAYMSCFHREMEIISIRPRGNPDSGRFTYTVGPCGFKGSPYK